MKHRISFSILWFSSLVLILSTGSETIRANQWDNVESTSAVSATANGTATKSETQPNIVFIMSDELAYFELSHMGNTHIHTPSIDQMAREGIRFTRALAAAPVCAPLRCALMTGKHMGHASVRSNGGGTPLSLDRMLIQKPELSFAAEKEACSKAV